VRRFARIYPVLLAALVLTFALDWVSLQLPPVNHKIREIGLQAFLVNLFSLQGVAGKTFGRTARSGRYRSKCSSMRSTRCYSRCAGVWG
jgi:hypothetical protein